MQAHGLPLALTQPRHGLPDDRPPLVSQELGVGQGHRVRLVPRPGQLLGQPANPLDLPQSAEARVTDNASQPAAETARIAQPGQLVVGDDEGLLHHVAAQLGSPRSPAATP